MGEKAGEIDKRELKEYQALVSNAKNEMRKIVVGQDEAINACFKAMIADGHILIEGIPGIAKTLIMIALSRVSGLQCRRIQFTADMLPSDITGINTYDPKAGFTTIKGPIFTNLVLADEINRAPAKVQSAMLEAMQEKKTTIGGETYAMMNPFLVLATQNNVESLGVYTLPAAQVDRFLFKIVMLHPKKEEEKEILQKNMTIYSFDDFGLKQLMKPDQVLKMQKLVHQIYASDEVNEYIVDLVDATRKPSEYGIENGKYIEYGSSPRATIGLYIASKAQAFMQGSTFITPAHVKNVAKDILRHRLILNYEGQAERVDPDMIIEEILNKVAVP